MSKEYINHERCVKDENICQLYSPYSEAAYNFCMYGSSLEDYETVPPCMNNETGE